MNRTGLVNFSQMNIFENNFRVRTLVDESTPLDIQEGS